MLDQLSWSQWCGADGLVLRPGKVALLGANRTTPMQCWGLGASQACTLPSELYCQPSLNRQSICLANIEMDQVKGQRALFWIDRKFLTIIYWGISPVGRVLALHAADLG